MKKIYLLLFPILLSLPVLNAQMIDGKFGNEWINFDQSYFKITVVEDGIYRISKQQLEDAQIPLSSIDVNQFQLFHLGEEVPLYSSTAGNLGNSDYLEFYGRRNRSELDQHLFEDPTKMLCPDYSLFNDSSAYFLTWVDNGVGERYASLANDLNNAPAKETHFSYEEFYTLETRAHVKPYLNGDGAAFSNYGNAEGFSFGLVNEQTLEIEPKFIVANAETSELRIRMAMGIGKHHPTIQLNGNEIYNETGLQSYELQNLTFDVSSSVVSAGASVVIKGLESTTDKMGVGSMSLVYPRSFNFDGTQSFNFTLNGDGNKKYLEIENFDVEGQAPILYNITTQQRMVTDLSGNVVQVALPSVSNNENFVLVSSVSGSKTVGNLQAVNFIDFSQQEVQYLIISNERLFDDGQGNDRVEEYATYRSSVKGGSYTSQVVKIQQLYDQYAFGIDRHPLSVKNFVQQISRTWDDLQYILILGKGREYHKVRSPQEQINAQSTFLVPTFGFPGADNLLLSDKGDHFPLVPFGRLAVNNPTDIKVYLEKVKALEGNQQDNNQTIEERGWMKDVLHLGGGNAAERDLIKTHLSDLENVIENNQFAGNVTSFYKRSSDPVQISKSEEIFNAINKGLSMITFFGHSGVGTFDFDIDNPENYNNFGKYPLMFSLGCYSGNIHTSARGISERFVYYEDKGAIGFGATTGLGYVGPLHQFTKELYNLAGTSYYGKGIGDIFKATIANYNNTNATTMVTLIQQFTLQGDPAVRLNPSPGPDYTIDVESVNFNPTVVNAQQDSFEMIFDIVNLGYGIEDTLSIEITQEFPNGELEVVVDTKILTPLNHKVVNIKIPSRGKKSIGLNRFYVKLDHENEIEELPDPTAELNNQLRRSSGELGISLFIIDDTAQPVFPLNFSIVNTNPTLKATTIDALSKEKKYLLEIDTTELFNSALKKREEIVQGGGVINWKPSINYVPNTVYYWRISPDSTIAEIGFNWTASSFTYLPDESEGWNQSHYYQYLKDDFSFLDLKAEGQRFEFGKQTKDFRLKNKIYGSSTERPGFWINGGEQVNNYFPWFINEGVSISVIKSSDLIIWKNSAAGDHNSISDAVSRTYSYETDTPEKRQDVMTFLEDIIPDSVYVIFWTLQRNVNSNYLPEDWAADSISTGKNIFSILEAQGATQVRQLADKGPLPYGFAYQKGVGPIREAIGQDILSTINIDWPLTRPLTEGSMRSTLIGPVSEWQSLETSVSEITDPASDSIRFTVYGINASLNDTTALFENIMASTLDLSSVNPIQYPYLQLEYFAKDPDNRTAPQLDHWRVYYKGIPEASVNATHFFKFYNDTIQQGDDFYFEIAIENLSQYDMDSLLVKYTVTDEQNTEIVHYDRLAKLPESEIIRSSLELSTKSLSNKQRLTLEINPDDDQPELFHFNNFAVKDFFVEKDQRNPIMDVTFDGLYIMNGDIVSSRPEIAISLKDENPFLELGDTSLFKIFIKYPNRELGQRISFNDEILQFFPASSSDIEDKNEAYVELRPTFTEDGTYELIIQSEDATGNQSGDVDYKVAFEVINKQAISRVLNYPNPFSNSTQFVYTLTGSTTPDYFKIQIMTVAGKIVREITQDEIGPLKIGTHRTDYTWDGTDEYGGRLANGVYLYRVIAKDAEGLNFDRHETNTSQFFKNEFGKMVIMR